MEFTAIVFTAQVFTVKGVYSQHMKRLVFTDKDDLDKGLQPKEMLMAINSHCAWVLVDFKDVNQAILLYNKYIEEVLTIWKLKGLISA